MNKVIITGGSRGIGAATAVEAAYQGYFVCINYKENQQAAEALVNTIITAGGKAMAITADVSKEAEVIRMFESIDKLGGNLTGL